MASQKTFLFKIKNSFNKPGIKLISFIMLFAIIVTVGLLLTRAAGPSVGTEAERGSSPAPCNNTSGASGGGCIQFCPSTGCGASSGVLAVAAGDIIWPGKDNPNPIVAAIKKMSPAPQAFLTLGDTAYTYNQDFQFDSNIQPPKPPDGNYSNKRLCWGYSYAGRFFSQAGQDRLGDLQSIIYPSFGNHEYLYEPNASYTETVGGKKVTYTCNRTSGKTATDPAKPFFTYLAHDKVGGPGGIPASADGTSGDFNSRKGYYSYNIGGWHMIALNSECNASRSNPNGAVPGGCGTSSPQYKWLQADLAAHQHDSCIAAYFHRPPWFAAKSSTPAGAVAGDQLKVPDSTSQDAIDFNNDIGEDLSDYTYNADAGLYQQVAAASGSTSPMLPMMKLLYNYKADAVFTGHAHIYQHVVPKKVDASNKVVTAADGITEFVVGSGGGTMSDQTFTSNQWLGHSTRGYPSYKDPLDDDFGFLKMILHTGSMEYKFIGANPRDPGETDRVNQGEPAPNANGMYNLTCHPKS